MTSTFELDAAESMSRHSVGDLVVDVLEKAGVQRIYGVAGHGLHGLAEAIRRRRTIDWVYLRHVRAAAYAASWEAQMTGELAVCAGSFGAEDLDLIEGLSGAHRSCAPVLAIAAHMPSSEARRGDFLKTSPQTLFRDCSHYCEHLSDLSQAPLALDNAMRAAVGLRGVAAVVIPALSGGFARKVGAHRPACEQTGQVAAFRGRAAKRATG
jgi:pyruvate dehydrogenase (quinone)